MVLQDEDDVQSIHVWDDEKMGRGTPSEEELTDDDGIKTHHLNFKKQGKFISVHEKSGSLDSAFQGKQIYQTDDAETQKTEIYVHRIQYDPDGRQAEVTYRNRYLEKTPKL